MTTPIMSINRAGDLILWGQPAGHVCGVLPIWFGNSSESTWSIHELGKFEFTIGKFDLGSVRASRLRRFVAKIFKLDIRYECAKTTNTLLLGKSLETTTIDGKPAKTIGAVRDFLTQFCAHQGTHNWVGVSIANNVFTSSP